MPGSGVGVASVAVASVVEKPAMSFAPPAVVVEASVATVDAGVLETIGLLFEHDTSRSIARHTISAVIRFMGNRPFFRIGCTQT